MVVHPYGPAPEKYTDILNDIRGLLDGQACVDSESFGVDKLLDYALPAVSRRFCELAASVGQDMKQFTSAGVLVCAGHDRKEKVLDIALHESFPAYGLDRFIVANRGYWNLHTHRVHYDSNNPKHNRSIVARALLSQINKEPPPKWDANLDDTLNTPSEHAASIQSIRVMVPRDLHDFDQVDPGVIVAADVIYYAPQHPAADVNGYNWVGVEIDRWNEMEHIIGELHHLSKAVALGEEHRRTVIGKVGDFLSKEGKTLRDIAIKVYELATQS